jgi:hypothetical protein
MSEAAEVHVDPHDTYGKKIGVQAAVLAVLLSIFTISAHRAHTETIVLQNSANDAWSQYQAKRIRDYQLGMNLDLLQVLAVSNPKSKTLIAAYTKKHEEYKKDLDEIQKEAKNAVHESTVLQQKALYFDFSEGVLEISLVMSSLYFISKRKFFPRLGLLFGLIGTIVGFLGLFLL